MFYIFPFIARHSSLYQYMFRLRTPSAVSLISDPVCAGRTWMGDGTVPLDTGHEGHDFRIQQVLELILVQIKVYA